LPLIRERRYRGHAKPPVPVLRTDHPFADRLAGAWSFVAGAVSGSGMVPHSLAGEFGPNGLAITASGSNQIVLTGTDIFTGTEFHTLVLLYRDASAGADYPGLFATGMGGTWKGFGILRTPTGDGNKIYCEVASGSLTLQTYSQVASNTGTDGSWRVAAMTYDGATLIQYDNGIEVARNTGATGALSIQGGFSIGGRLDSASVWTRWAGGVSLGYWWQGRALRAGEIAEVSADPFALIRPRQFWYFGDVAGGPNTVDSSDAFSSAESGSLAATLAASDSGSTADAASLAATLAGSDSGSVADSSGLGAALPGSDSGSAADSAGLSASLAGSDSGSAADSASLAAAISGSETATAADASALSVALAASESVGAAESASLSVSVSASDSGSLSESADLFQGSLFSTDDAASLADSASLAATLAGSDSLALAEGAGLALAGSDPGSLSDAASLAAALAGSDAASLADAASLSVSISASDSAGASDAGSSPGQDTAAFVGSDAVTVADTASLAADADRTLAASDALGLGESAALRFASADIVRAFDGGGPSNGSGILDMVIRPSGRVKLGEQFSVPFRLVSTLDHTTPLTNVFNGLDVRISEGLQAFALADTGSVSEIGDGWYQVVVKPKKLGPLVVSAKYAGADDGLAWVEVNKSLCGWSVNAQGYGVIPFFAGSPAYPGVGQNGLLFPSKATANGFAASFVPGTGSVEPVGGLLANCRGWYLYGDQFASPHFAVFRATSNTGVVSETATWVGPALSSPGAGSGGMLNKILRALRLHLIDTGFFSESCVQHVIEEEPFQAWGTPFCSVVPGPQRPSGPMVVGGGRAETVIDGSFLVRVYLRTRTDYLQADTDALVSLADGLGLTALEWKVRSGLQTKFLEDPSGESLLIEPLTEQSSGRGRRYKSIRDWIWCEMVFETSYLETLSSDDDFQSDGTIF
jgi:hypothetical protein